MQAVVKLPFPPQASRSLHSQGCSGIENRRRLESGRFLLRATGCGTKDTCAPEYPTQYPCRTLCPHWKGIPTAASGPVGTPSHLPTGAPRRCPVPRRCIQHVLCRSQPLTFINCPGNPLGHVALEGGVLGAFLREPRPPKFSLLCQVQ